jgi:Raf kinase inhibitor-like YbhB/YbcL family protein
VTGSGFRLESPSFRDGEPISKKNTGFGKAPSPPLRWSGVPDRAEELALICQDLDVPSWINVTHWIVYNIPPGIGGLPENVPRTKRLDNGIVQGRRTFGGTSYMGPRPPGRKAHRYRFRLYALDAKLGLEKSVGRSALMRLMEGHVIESADLLGTCARE